MTDILIRNINPAIEVALREKAKATRQSLSDVAQELIQKGLVQPSMEHGLGTAIRNLVLISDYGDLDIPRDAGNVSPPVFE